MADYLILKHNNDDTDKIPWEPTQLVTDIDTAAELKEIVRQGYLGGGKYRVVRWDNGKTFDMKPGPVDVTETPS